MCIFPIFIVQQTPPRYIHQPGSVCLRHLGELSQTQFREDRNICLFSVLCILSRWIRGEGLGCTEQIGWFRGECIWQSRFRFLKQTGEPLHTAEHQWWRCFFHFFYNNAQAYVTFFEI